MLTRTLAVGLCLLITSSALAEAPSAQQMADEMAAMRAQMAEQAAMLKAAQAQIAALNAEKGETWMSDVRREQVKQIVGEMMADADTRASLLGSGLYVGNTGDGFVISNAEGTRLLKIGGQLQFRYIYNTGDQDEDEDDIDEHKSGFDFARAKIGFDGQYDEMMFGVGLALDQHSDDIRLERAWVGVNLTDDLYVWGGRYKDRYNAEETIHSGHQLAVERSLVNEVFTRGYVEGIGAEWMVRDDVRIGVSIDDGPRSGEDRTDDDEDEGPGLRFSDDRNDFAISSRIDWKASGDWNQSWMPTYGAGSEDYAFFGGGIHYQEGETGTESDNFSRWGYTIDGLCKHGGLSLYGAFLGQHIDVDGTDDDYQIDQHGVVAQAGVEIIPDRLDAFVRYEWADLDEGRFGDASNDELSILTIGTNYYPHVAGKLSVDFLYAFQPIPDQRDLGVPGGVLDQVGLMPDSGDEDGQFAIRAQYQLLF